MAWRDRWGRSDDPAPRDVDDALTGLSQTHADADQSAADIDADASQVNSASSLRDQVASNADQRASDADQATADLEFLAKVDPSDKQVEDHAVSRDQRENSKRGRRETADVRAEVEVLRVRTDARRFETATIRDEVAVERDRAADLRDAAARRANARLLADNPTNDALRALITANGELRDQTLIDRRRAAVDRQHAAEDRLTAAAAQRQARLEIQRAQLDNATGVFASELGHAALAGEIDRCRRTSAPFMLAYVAIDEQHPGTLDGGDDPDALMRSVVATLREKLRSYDPVIREDSRTFLCGMPGTRSGAAHERVAEIREAVAHGHPPGTISAGFAQFEPQDTLESLLGRAYLDLLAQSHRPG